ncbi:HNH endonuclease [Nakamurella multipartita]|nr:HNH endonuclease [Nakamurella multipartita]
MSSCQQISAMVAELAALNAASDPERIELLSALERVKGAVAAAQARLTDAFAVSQRARLLAVDRRVSIRPAPDCMAYVTALLPTVQGVAVFGALHRAALAGAVDPDEHRSKGQIMADELVRRVLTPGEGAAEVPGIELHVVMTDRTLLDGDDEPAQVVGYGPVPAPVARDLVRADSKTKVWVRRLYTNPETGELAGTDARKRDFPEVARTFLTLRDQLCRTPWCGAPIRHVDHAVAVAKGGVTDLRNGNGRCARCNLRIRKICTFG